MDLDKITVDEARNQIFLLEENEACLSKKEHSTLAKLRGRVEFFSDST